MSSQESDMESNKPLIAKIFVAGFVRVLSVIGVALALCALLWGAVETLTYFCHLLMLGDKKPVLGWVHE